MWQQQFAWTEAGKEAKLVARSALLSPIDKLAQQPLFCFETMMHLIYFSCLVYDYKRVRHIFRFCGSCLTDTCVNTSTWCALHMTRGKQQQHILHCSRSTLTCCHCSTALTPARHVLLIGFGMLSFIVNCVAVSRAVWWCSACWATNLWQSMQSRQLLEQVTCAGVQMEPLHECLLTTRSVPSELR